MTEWSLFVSAPNISSVKLLSPFRYPGGKTWLAPGIVKWVASLPFRPVEFIEPFAGGAIVGLTVAFERMADHVTLVELDEKVGAVWQAIIGEEHGPWLAEQIKAFELTIESVDGLLAKEDLPLRERAFQTIVHNRVSRGGILANGAGLIKYGDGKGIASRWYPKTLASFWCEIAASGRIWGQPTQAIDYRSQHNVS
jgi:DNA adenine methylase